MSNAQIISLFFRNNKPLLNIKEIECISIGWTVEDL